MAGRRLGNRMARATKQGPAPERAVAPVGSVQEARALLQKGDILFTTNLCDGTVSWGFAKAGRACRPDVIASLRAEGALEPQGDALFDVHPETSQTWRLRKTRRRGERRGVADGRV